MQLLSINCYLCGVINVSQTKDHIWYWQNIYRPTCINIMARTYWRITFFLKIWEISCKPQKENNKAEYFDESFDDRKRKWIIICTFVKKTAISDWDLSFIAAAAESTVFWYLWLKCNFVDQNLEQSIKICVTKIFYAGKLISIAPLSRKSRMQYSSQWSMLGAFWMRTKMPDLLFLSLSVIIEFYVPIKSPYRVMPQFIKFIHCFCTSWPIDHRALIFRFPNSLIRKFSNDLLPLRRKVFLNRKIFIGWEEFIWCFVWRKNTWLQ